MLNKLLKTIVLFTGVLLVTSASHASFMVDSYTLGAFNEITFFDGQSNNSDPWYSGSGGTSIEDDEIEYDTATGQDWDLEGMFFSDNKLFVIGGFDFLNGNNSLNSQHPIYIGDLFISTDKNYGAGAEFSTYGYEYVMNFNNKPPALTGAFDTISGAYQTFGTTEGISNPSDYYGGGNTVVGSGGTYEIQQNINVSGYFNGDIHNALIFDLNNFITNQLGGDASGLYFHLTETCGNDDLMGHTPIPEPGTILLFGIGLLGLGAVSRRKN